MLAMVETAKAQGLEGLWGDFDPDGPLPPMITRSADVDVRIPLGPYQRQKLAALRSHRSQVNLDDPFWKLMTMMDGLGESFLLATGVPLPNGTATDLFEGLDLNP
jgi:N-acetyl-1-D-myo-inositol-2-amino-2-deoxy-alpha-D-glucopyranoside deacetylase